VEAPALALEPETSDAVEIGATFAAEGLLTGDDALALKATAFRYDISDLIARSPGVETPFRVNVGSARISGVELEGSYEAERAFARLALAATDGEDEETGETLTSIPAESLVLTLGGRLPGRGVEYGWQGSFVGGITIPQQDQFGQTVDTRFGGHATHDLFLDWTPGSGPLRGTEFRLGVDNVLDKDFRNSLAGDDGPGRSFKITLTRGLSW
jgi:hemoglobin/transferrin/lactoferrin receptor protein